MFTGLIDDVGVIDAVQTTAVGRVLKIQTRYESLADGESVAVTGACLTVRTSGPRWFEVAAVVTTLQRTTIGSWQVGHRVNLERALRVGDRLGGHLVQGHVDDVGRVDRAEQLGDAWLIDIELPHSLVPLMVLHGSVAVDGVSLTVNALPRPGILQVSVIDHTLRHTTLGSLKAGDQVHIEADMLGKYVQQLLVPYQRASV